MNHFILLPSRFLAIFICLCLCSPLLWADPEPDNTEASEQTISSTPNQEIAYTLQVTEKEDKLAKGIDVDLDNIGGGFAPKGDKIDHTTKCKG